jgi:hypothetical protein
MQNNYNTMSRIAPGKEIEGCDFTSLVLPEPDDNQARIF